MVRNSTKAKYKNTALHSPGSESSAKNNLPYLIIFILSFVVYCNTLTNDYALDDTIVILQNQFTKKGIKGIKDILQHDTFTGYFGIQKNLVAGGRYRPLSLVTFALEYELFGENPFISHLINILLYALTCMILYSVLRKLLLKYDSNRKWILSVSFITVILFVLHPIHTEVVANIKGRDEILALLGALATWYYTIRYHETRKSGYLVAGLLVFFLALMSKENAITFLAIIPLSVYFFKRSGLNKHLISWIPLIIASALFLIIRQKMLGSFKIPVSGELMNNPFVYATAAEKAATIIYTWGIYLRLLLFPHPLTFDYYPKQIPLINFSDARATLSLLIYLFIAVVALAGIKKKKLIAFAILLFAASFSILSNLFFNVGTFLNERFMYISSIGFCLILAYALIWGLPKLIKRENLYRKSVVAIIILIAGLYAVKTIARNTDWKNDYILFTHDVKISANSAKGNCSAGGSILEQAVKIRTIKNGSRSFNDLNRKIEKETLLSSKEKKRILQSGNLEKAKAEIELMEKGMMQLSISYLNKAVKIYPTYIDALLLLGNTYYEFDRNYQETVGNYLKILRIDPDYDHVYSNLEKVFKTCDDTDLKINAWEDIIKLNPNRFEPNYQLGNLYGRYKNNMEKAIPFLERAVEIKPANARAFKNLGVAYAISKRYADAIRILEKAFELDSTDVQIVANLGITYHMIGNEEKAQEYFKKAQNLDPNFKIPR